MLAKCVAWWGKALFLYIMTQYHMYSPWLGNILYEEIFANYESDILWSRLSVKTAILHLA
jgi:hypothetical protein